MKEIEIPDFSAYLEFNEFMNKKDKFIEEVFQSQEDGERRYKLIKGIVNAK